MDVEVSDLVGRTIVSIKGLRQYSEKVEIRTECGHVYTFLHRQDCCESVALEDFENDIVVPALVVGAEESLEDGAENEWESSTWTFYLINTTTGSLSMRWLGGSNGYYSESVDVIKSKVWR